MAAKDESRMGRLARTGLRWALGIFIVFGIGFLVALFALYQPAINETREVQSELESANEQIADLQAEVSALEGEIDSLQGVQEQADELQAQLDENEVEMLILRARASVAQARLSLFTEEENQFTLYWDTTMDALSRIKAQLPSSQQDAIESLEQRMILVADEFAESPDAAQSDLEIIGNRLLELQDNLFGAP
jgi:TolA-binding protein